MPQNTARPETFLAHTLCQELFQQMSMNKMWQGIYNYHASLSKMVCNEAVMTILFHMMQNGILGRNNSRTLTVYHQYRVNNNNDNNNKSGNFYSA